VVALDKTMGNYTIVFFISGALLQLQPSHWATVPLMAIDEGSRALLNWALWPYNPVGSSKHYLGSTARETNWF